MKARLSIFLGWAVFSLSGFAGDSRVDLLEVDFNRTIRPLLSNHCFVCHGPSKTSDKKGADLRLDTAEGLRDVVVPGKPDQSELIARIFADDDQRMPPATHHKPLSDQQKELLRSWIQEGAKSTDHWSFVVPKKPSLPAFRKEGATGNPIDRFIQQRLKAVGLVPNGQADRRTLVRRVYFDLTGLPPTTTQMNAFLADSSADAYERLIDRLLESPRYGEHMGRYWLDVVRYGDTHGLHFDNYREMWPYRDWVLEAFKINKPFDVFIREQLAGDLLLDRTLKQTIASGYNRLNVTTNENGSIDSEVFFRNVVDRVDAFGTVFLGLTMGCAVCHDHKYDPITQQDYYSLFAFFNNLDATPMDGNQKAPAPFIRVPIEPDQQALKQLDESAHRLGEQMQAPIPSVDEAQAEWESLLSGKESARWQVLEPDVFSAQKNSTLSLKKREDDWIVASGTPSAKDILTIEAPLPSSHAWQVLRLEVFPHGEEGGLGLASNGNAVLSEIEVHTKSKATEGLWLPIPFYFADADYEQPGGPFAVAYAIDGKVDTDKGWAVGGLAKTGQRTAWFLARGTLGQGEDARLRVRLKYPSKYPQDPFLRVRLAVGNRMPRLSKERQVVLGPWHQVGPFKTVDVDQAFLGNLGNTGLFNLEQTFNHRGQIFKWTPHTDWRDIPLQSPGPFEDGDCSTHFVTCLHRTLTAPRSGRVRLLLGCDQPYQVWLNDALVTEVRYEMPFVPLGNPIDLELSKGTNHLYLLLAAGSGQAKLSLALEAPVLPVPESIQTICKRPLQDRSAEQKQTIRNYFRHAVCMHPDWTVLEDQWLALIGQRKKLTSPSAVSLVWRERKQSRQTHVMKRGQYDDPGDAVSPNVPKFLPRLQENGSQGRLALADWLTDPSHPLTSRVVTNRFWQQIFGMGLVRTSEDFGSQGDPPSHPKLLDWLAVDFREHGWNVKRLMKQLVMSEAYRRDAAVTAEMLKVDPDNRFLARGPRFRLDAEMLRDQAMALSGLLVNKWGGPGVKPPQPSGLWKAVGFVGSNTARFRADAGDAIYRRSVYTFWKRTSPPPQMTTFDAPSRESCTSRRERTNTPLQALVLLNEPQYVEATKRLGVFAMAVTAKNNEHRMDALFEKVTLRPPTDKERSKLISLLNETKRMYEGDLKRANAFVGDQDPILAAWTIVASVLLNLDEVLNK